MAYLDTIADHQAQWSQSADRLKSTTDHARWLVFVLSILGALAAAFASQLEPPAAGLPLTSSLRTWVAVVGVLSLAAATFFTSRLLGTEHVTAWTRARAIAESLKREAFKFAATAKPYDDTNRDNAAAVLEEERKKIENDGLDLLPLLVKATGAGSLPREAITNDEYVRRRVNDQIDWYNDKAERYKKIARRLRLVEFVLALAATLITAVATVTGKLALLWGVTFDVAALTAVLTTIAGSVLAHVEALRYDFLVTTYMATARRLEERRNAARPVWSDFVNECENILAAENTSWIAKWTRVPGKT